MAGDPDASRATQLLLLLPVDRSNGVTKRVALPSLDLHERDYPVVLDHEIDVAVPCAKPALYHAPPSLAKPSLRDPLPEFTQCLPGR